MIKALIVDDESKSRELLGKMLNRYCTDIGSVRAAANIGEAEAFIKSDPPDVVFLDIELSGENGFDLLRKMFPFSFKVIFTTAFDKYAIQAIKFSAMDYLLKPIDVEELIAAVDKFKSDQKVPAGQENISLLLENFRQKENTMTKICLPTGNAYEVVSLDQIIRCESDGHYTHFILTNGKKVFVSTGLKHYEDILPSNVFIRVHHSHLININHVERYLKTDGGYAIMSDQSQVEISRRKKEAFLERLQHI